MHPVFEELAVVQRAASEGVGAMLLVGYDLVFATHVLEHVPDPAPLMRELLETLKDIDTLVKGRRFAESSL